MIIIHFSGASIISTSEDAISLSEKSSFGEYKSGKVQYSGVEALYLLEKGKVEVHSNKKKLSSNELIKKLETQDKKIETKLAVYTDMRDKGYILKTALKFGAEFRVYERGSKPGQSHARWVLYTAREHDLMSWHDFAAKNRVAHSVKKALLLAIVDDEGDVSYYNCNWIKV